MSSLFTTGNADDAAKVLGDWADSKCDDSGEDLWEAVGVIVEERDHLKQIAATAIEMRAGQRRYFRERTTTALEESKKLERELDRLLKE